MGNLESMTLKDEEPFFTFLLCVAESSDTLPDVGIDNSLMKYSGLNSSSELENSVSQSLVDVATKTPDYLQSLGSGLASFNSVPNAVGIGALVISIVLELVIKVLQKTENQQSTVDMVRRVFAEEKASGVRDSMEEYLKRLGMCLHQPTKALEETERLEKQLSEQLTRLKNSMLHDKQMSSRSMKHWTNGAAFHLQMLIHAARLKMKNNEEQEAQLQVHVASITSALDRYHFNLQELIKQYKDYKKPTIYIFQPSDFNPWLMGVVGFRDWAVKDKEFGKVTPTVHYHKEMLGSSDAFVNYMFDNWSQIKQLNSYFSDLKENIKELITQNTEFNIQKVLPVSDKHGD